MIDHISTMYDVFQTISLESAQNSATFDQKIISLCWVVNEIIGRKSDRSKTTYIVPER